MNELRYILQRILWLRNDPKDNDAWAEIVDWIQKQENEITYGDLDGSQGEEYFLDNLVKALRS